VGLNVGTAAALQARVIAAPEGLDRLSEGMQMSLMSNG